MLPFDSIKDGNTVPADADALGSGKHGDTLATAYTVQINV